VKAYLERRGLVARMHIHDEVGRVRDDLEAMAQAQRDATKQIAMTAHPSLDDIQAWHREMEANEQLPRLMRSTDYGLKNERIHAYFNIEVAGRAFDVARDQERWEFMRKYRCAVALFLYLNHADRESHPPSARAGYRVAETNGYIGVSRHYLAYPTDGGVR
jgi:hypothetical protein